MLIRKVEVNTKNNTKRIKIDCLGAWDCERQEKGMLFSIYALFIHLFVLVYYVHVLL